MLSLKNKACFLSMLLQAHFVQVSSLTIQHRALQLELDLKAIETQDAVSHLEYAAIISIGVLAHL